MQGTPERIEIETYRLEQEFTPVRVREILEKDQKKREVKWKPTRREA